MLLIELVEVIRVTCDVLVLDEDALLVAKNGALIDVQRGFRGVFEAKKLVGELGREVTWATFIQEG